MFSQILLIGANTRLTYTLACRERFRYFVASESLVSYKIIVNYC